MSTDDSRSILQTFQNVVLHDYDTGDKIDNTHRNVIKNNYWKGLTQADWCMVVDVDEFVDIDYGTLQRLDREGYTAVKCVGFTLIGDTDDLHAVRRGWRSSNYDKLALFKRSATKEINYRPGCHLCDIQGDNVRIYHSAGTVKL